jgi:hypothetical protein
LFCFFDLFLTALFLFSILCSYTYFRRTPFFILFSGVFFRLTTKFRLDTTTGNGLEERLLASLRLQREQLSTLSDDVKQGFTSGYNRYDSNQITTNNIAYNSPGYTTHDTPSLATQLYITKEKVSSYIKKEHLQTISRNNEEQFTSDYISYDVNEITTHNHDEKLYDYETSDNPLATEQLDSSKDVMTHVQVHVHSEKINDKITPFTLAASIIDENRPEINVTHNIQSIDRSLTMVHKNTSLKVNNHTYYGPLQDVTRVGGEEDRYTSQIYDGYEMTMEQSLLDGSNNLNIFKYVFLFCFITLKLHAQDRRFILIDCFIIIMFSLKSHLCKKISVFRYKYINQFIEIGSHLFYQKRLVIQLS